MASKPAKGSMISPLISNLTNDARILKNGTAYQTDAGMCGDYDSVIGMNTENSINRFLKENSTKHFPAIGEATLSGVIVECDLKTGTDNPSRLLPDRWGFFFIETKET